MNKAYKKIMEQKGMKELKALVKRWDVLSENMKARHASAPIILPDIFLVSRSGTGRTHFLKLLSEYLTEKENLMDFYGDVKYFEFMLNYCAPNEHFSEIQRFMTEIDNAAGFRSEYRGIVYVELDEWCSHCEEKHFINFLEYLSDNSDDWLVVLSVSDGREKKTEKLETMISAFLRTEKITIEPPTVDEMMYYAKNLLLAYGFELDRKAEMVISESVDVLYKNKYFDGYKTIKMICQDIAYFAYTDGASGKMKLSECDVMKFEKNGEYIKRMILKIEKTAQIGFC